MGQHKSQPLGFNRQREAFTSASLQFLITLPQIFKIGILLSIQVTFGLHILKNFRNKFFIIFRMRFSKQNF